MRMGTRVNPAATAPSLDEHSRLARFSRFVIAHDAYASALATIAKAIKATGTTQESYSALVTGDSGTGKTTVCKHFIQLHTARRREIGAHDVREIVPAFYCAVTAEVTIKGLAEVMLRRLGATHVSGDKTQLTERLFGLLRTCKTEVIFLDEFHHLLRSRNLAVLDGVRDWVKGLMNETNIPVILAGLPKCETIIYGEEQTSRRFPYRASLSRFDYSTYADSQYIKVLKALANGMSEHAQLSVAPILTDADRATAIYAATGGNMNNIRQLLFQVASDAVDRHKERITWDDFAEAYESIRLDHSLVQGANPFKVATKTLEDAIYKSRQK
jgi:type II secretory pathway predicted ATPase ExeA